MTDALSSQGAAGLWSALIVLWFALSVLFRMKVGRPVFARSDTGDTFVERWASGRAGTGLLARVSSARNCLQVRVDRQILRVHPHFPFTLGFVPEVYGMDHVVPLSAIRSATILGGRHAEAVEVKFSLSDGQEQVLHLLFRTAEGFIHAVLGSRSSD